jgi:hypothetical protein
VSLDGARDISLDQAVLLVGRHPCCDVTIESPRVSRLHCCLSRQGDRISVCDLSSVNGTRINGQRAQSGTLRAGDELSIAFLRYRLEIESRSKATISPDAPLDRPHRSHSIGNDLLGQDHRHTELDTGTIASSAWTRPLRALHFLLSKKGSSIWRTFPPLFDKRLSERRVEPGRNEPRVRESFE